jgi:hypothetical protein
MKKKPNSFYDVYLSHDPLDSALAEAVIARLDEMGLTTFSASLTLGEPIEPFSEIRRRMIRDSYSFVILITPMFVRSDLLPFESGAASGGEAPVYLLSSGLHHKAIPSYLQKYPRFELWDAMPGLVQQLKKQSEPFSEETLSALAEAYREVGTSVDELLMDANPKMELMELFESKSKTRIPMARLMRELVRMRKARKLPRLEHAKAS